MTASYIARLAHCFVRLGERSLRVSRINPGVLLLSRALSIINRRRRRLSSRIAEEGTEKARRLAEARGEVPDGIVVGDEGWHQGVVGISASRIAERFHRPTVMLAPAKSPKAPRRGGGFGPGGGDGDREEQVLKGSARSGAGGVDLYEALCDCSGHLEGYGGHTAAAGLRVKAGRVDAFRRAFEKAVGRQLSRGTREEALTPALKKDSPLDLREIGGLGDRFWAVLRQFGPFGPGNARPVFHGRNLALAEAPRRVGSNGSHLKLKVCPREDPDEVFDAIGFSLGEKAGELKEARRSGEPIEALFQVEENTFRGNTSLQLKLKDIRRQNVPEKEPGRGSAEKDAAKAKARGDPKQQEMAGEGLEP